MDNVISWMVSPSMSKDQAVKVIEQAGGRYLGSGYSTQAYEYRVRFAKHPPIMPLRFLDPTAMLEPVRLEVVDEERCLRVSSNERGIRLTIESAMMEPDDPFAPKVYGYVELRDGAFACEMERLTDQYGCAYDDTHWKFGAGACGKHLPSDALFEVSPFMRRIERLRHTIGAEYDLHSNNVMWRSDPKHPVILDPIVALSD